MAQLITDLDIIPPSLRAAAVAIGNFDGVHRGHARLVAHLVDLAKRIGGPAVVLTFDPPPQAVLYPERPLSSPLTPIAQRAELLGALGVDAMIAYPTDPALLMLSAEEFFQRIIVNKLAAGGMVEGPNFRFGRDRAGDTDLLRQLCQRAGLKCRVVEAAADEVGLISSTRIRNLLAKGDVVAANEMLTRRYQLAGTVGSGARRGREIGFPTANLTDIKSLIPAHGVYAGQVEIDSTAYPAAINIGPNPTFGESATKVEVHIVGWQGTLYGERLQCSLVTRIRNVIKFDSIDSLRAQIQKDLQAVVRAIAPK